MHRDLNCWGMAGVSSAIPLYGTRLLGALLAVGLYMPIGLRAELDVRQHDEMRARSRMQNIYQDMMLAEQNLALAIEKNDFSRLVISLKFMSNVLSKDDAYNKPQSICEEAAQSLLGAASSGGLYLNRSAMTVKIDEEKVFDLGPSDEHLLASYDKYFSEYKIKISLCEAEMGRRETQRLLPEKLLRVK